ncbi:protease I [Deinobacterium chartae]|uniref:Protease I n=1 Tax=Deinobacterium chartae TaxID=521158 RepID=A0A841HWT1_9DEIO|nr:type 1 glutamine amidotransferase domain-containing protein [Deinobacterium chartae]MBB6097376.1 protease I [Deinobacterium chartae]
MAKKLRDLKVAALAADGFEQVELTQPMKALRRHGARVDVISLRPGRILGMNLLFPGRKVRVNRTVFTARPERYDALLLPGGFINPDFLRQSERAKAFVRHFDALDKPIAAICHAPWTLISAGLVAGRRLTSWPSLQDDVRNAGGRWENRPVVHDRNWISSRGPQDLLAFNRALVTHFARHALPRAQAPEAADGDEVIRERRGPSLWVVLLLAALALLGTRRVYRS